MSKQAISVKPNLNAKGEIAFLTRILPDKEYQRRKKHRKQQSLSRKINRK